MNCFHSRTIAAIANGSGGRDTDICELFGAPRLAIAQLSDRWCKGPMMSIPVSGCLLRAFGSISVQHGCLGRS